MSKNEVVKTIIDREGITQKKFAEIVEVSEQLVSKWVKGPNLPTEKGLLKIIMEFRAYNPYWIITGKGNPDNTEWEESKSGCKNCDEKDRTIQYLEDHIKTLKTQLDWIMRQSNGQTKVG